MKLTNTANEISCATATTFLLEEQLSGYCQTSNPSLMFIHELQTVYRENGDADTVSQVQRKGSSRGGSHEISSVYNMSQG